MRIYCHLGLPLTGNKSVVMFLLLIPLVVLMLVGSSPAMAGANELAGCGGDGQRACCAGTFEVLLGDACDSGNTEVPGCSGNCLCGGFNLFGVNASGTCKAREECGGENQRACCDGLSEGQACDAGLIKIEGCAGNCLCGGIGTGQVAVHSCVKPAPCGGEGQRACCAVPLEPRRTELNGPCEAGLVEIKGCTGDCACGDELLTVGKSSGTCVAADWATNGIDEPGTQWVEPAGPRECPLQGYADLHLHLNAHLAHGQNVFAGQPAPVGDDGTFTLESASGLDINSALSPAADLALHGDNHGLIDGDKIGDGTKDGSTGNGGAPAFNNWPTWTTTTHQQTYYSWLERAYRGGLRLAVMLAVTNEALCKSTDGADCDNSMGPIDDQLDAAYDFQEFIDGLHGGEGQGWFRIVTEPLNARQVIADGKLAVVLGIEVDNLFNCKERNSNRSRAQCPFMLDEYELQRQAAVTLDDLPDAGTSLVVAALVGASPDLHIRIFDSDGIMVVDKAENELVDGRLPIEEFKETLSLAITNPSLVRQYSTREFVDFTASMTGYSVFIENKDGEPIDSIEKAVAHYYDKGVRHVFPIHNFDNAFGAAAAWQDVIGVGNAYSEKRWWVVENCGTGNGDYGYWIDNVLFPLLSLLGFSGETPAIPAYTNGVLNPDFASCNKYGLNLDANSPGPDKRGLGTQLIDALMAQGIVIDIDHMSRKSLNQTLELAGQRNPTYPLVASHVQFFDLHEMEFTGNAGRHERMRTKAQLEAIRAGGGMIAAMTKDDVQDTGNKGLKFTVPYAPDLGPAINDDCRHSSSTFAQAYQYAVDTMGAPVAFGSDFNGIAGHVGPRFGSGACGGDIPLSAEVSATLERSSQIRGENRLVYPFELPGFGEFDMQVSGVKSFDFNVDGLAHVGLLPDLVKDMETIGLSEPYVEAIFNSAEEYIRVWERSKAISEGTPIPAPPEELSCPALALGACFDDITPPEVTCPADLVMECSAPETTVNFGPVSATADSCGPALLQGCNPASGSAFDVGITPVTCSAIDSARNVGSCNMFVTIEDTTPPQITCPADIVAECTAGHGAVVTPGSAIGSDICSTAVSLTEYVTQTFSLGTTMLTYEAIDEQGLSASCLSDITVVDTTPPVISSVSVTPDTLWPPNHKMKNVSVQVDASDACDTGVSLPSCSISAITSNEPVNGPGDGNTARDWQITGALTAKLRSERSGSGSGRNYTLEITCTDQQGLSTKATAVVSVDQNRGNNTSSDSGNPDLDNQQATSNPPQDINQTTDTDSGNPDLNNQQAISNPPQDIGQNTDTDNDEIGDNLKGDGPELFPLNDQVFATTDDDCGLIATQSMDLGNKCGNSSNALPDSPNENSISDISVANTSANDEPSSGTGGAAGIGLWFLVLLWGISLLCSKRSR